MPLPGDEGDWAKLDVVFATTRGDADRIHLVLGARVDRWIEGLFAEALAAPQAPAGPA